MKFIKTSLPGAYVIEIEPREDERGFFARTWDAEEFRAHGLDERMAQCSISYNKRKGTLRGLHYQAAPLEEAKLVRCTAGAFYDVIVDIRPASDAYKQWFGIELSASNRKMLYVPQGFAHGFQTLQDDTEVFYQITEFYQSDLARGIRWNDPMINVRWPLEERTVSGRDETFPDFNA